jgi:hypothetical protein
MKQYEEIAVLEQGEDGAIVSIRGEEGPFVLLGPKYLAHLGTRLRAANERIAALAVTRNVEAVSALCAEMESLLKTYDDTCCKYTGGVTAAKSLADIEHEIEELRKQLSKL